MAIKIILKPDWDVDINLPTSNKKTGYFVGRKKEKEFLLAEILTKPSGSILVCGHRGVGKTSLIYSVLWEIRERSNNIIPIVINVSQLHTYSHNEIKPEDIIKNLIRRLYTSTKYNSNIPKEVRKDIEKLYKKAIAEQFKLLENYQNYLAKEHVKVREQSVEISWRELLNSPIFLILWSIAIALLSLPSLTIVPESVQKLLGILLLSGSVLIRSVLKERKKEKLRKEKREK